MKDAIRALSHDLSCFRPTLGGFALFWLLFVPRLFALGFLIILFIPVTVLKALIEVLRD
jgi:hypothetical protein